jgi:hypothetical protein
MKIGDIIKLPHNLGYAIAMKVTSHGKDPQMPTGEIAVMVMGPNGEDWWDASVCMVINESR